MDESLHIPRSSEAPPGRTPPPQVPLSAYVPPNDEVSLFDLLGVLARHWCLILLVVVAGSGGAVLYAFQATPIYRAQAVIAPPQQKKASTASAALAAFGGLGAEIAGTLGISIGGADANRIEALLKSHRLVERVVHKNNLLPVLFIDDFDEQKNTWRDTRRSGPPDVWDAKKLFADLYKVRNDVKSGTLTVTVEFTDAGLAKNIVQFFLDEVALMIQEDELASIQTNKQFIEEQLKKTSDPTIVAKLQALLSEQIENAMMAHNVEHFAYEVVDPPAASRRKVKPNRIQIAGLGLTVSLFAGTLLAFIVEWAGNARKRARPAGR